jgi:hypothetical protein
LAVLAVLAGIGLRGWHAGAPLLFMDEIHSVERAATASYAWIFTNFTTTDFCSPLTACAKWMMDHGGLDEARLRLPGVLAGAGLVVLVAVAARRYLPAPDALLLIGAAALSPYLVYLSREARPYPVTMLLFSAACLCVFAWGRGAARRCLVAGFSMASLALYFHLIVMPATLVLYVFPAVLLGRRRAPPAQWRDYAWAVACGGLVALVTLGPLAEAILAQAAAKGHVGCADLETVRHGMMLLFGSPWVLPLTAWILLLGFGAWQLGRSYPRETTCLVAMVLAQNLAVFRLQPWLVQWPAVWFRYQAHLIPFELAAASVALGAALRFSTRRFGTGMALWLSALLATGVGVYHAGANHYYLMPSSDSYNRLPDLLFVPRHLTKVEGMPTRFYDEVAPNLSTGGFIEAPMDLMFTLYPVYQRIHQRPVRYGALGGGPWEMLFDGRSGMEFHSVVDLTGATVRIPPGFRYLVLHKRIHEETREVTDAVLPHIEGMRIQRRPPVASLRNWKAMRWLYGPTSPSLPASLVGRWPVVFSDDWVEVYDLGAARAPDHPA